MAGRFKLATVPSGTAPTDDDLAHTIAVGIPGTSMPYFAETEFVVTDQDVSGIVLQFERGISITGQIVPPAGTAAGDVARVRLGIVPVDC